MLYQRRRLPQMWIVNEVCSRAKCPKLADTGRFAGLSNRPRDVRQRFPFRFKCHMLVSFVTVRLLVRRISRRTCDQHGPAKPLTPQATGPQSAAVRHADSDSSSAHIRRTDQARYASRQTVEMNISLIQLRRKRRKRRTTATTPQVGVTDNLPSGLPEETPCAWPSGFAAEQVQSQQACQNAIPTNRARPYSHRLPKAPCLRRHQRSR
ncbi:hypothetical protein AWB69_05706 [Caballeronia udeis]|uniref:Uncharacterized protein n=1 Tax=Caballeronia udeis TaxID=1232866 RepID=A0A158IBE5_9BURK|nr:hypothetical protein AWB69_05706 [Caballeronia udeis]